jgi:WD40 repeat protein
VRIVEDTGGVQGCAFSPDGRLILSASANDYRLRLWDVASGASVRTFTGHTGAVQSCALSPDGRLALSAAQDDTLRLWEVASGQSVCTLKGHTAEVKGCAFGLGGRLALSSSLDHTLRLWEVASGKELARWLTDVVLLCCAYGPDGRQVLAGDALGGVHFLEVVGIEGIKPAAAVEAAVPSSDSAAYGEMAPPSELGSAMPSTSKPKRGVLEWLRRRR